MSVRITIDQLDKLSDLKDKNSDADVIELATIDSKGCLIFHMEDGYENELQFGRISPTGDLK